MSFPLYGLRICCAAACAAAILCGPLEAGIGTPFSLFTYARNVIVWQEFHPWLMITEDLADGRVCYYHSHTDGSRMYLKPAMAGSWTPLGSAIKWLMYVDHYQGLDRLMAHDVDWHAYYIAWRSTENQVGCGMAGTKCIFGQYRPSMAGDHYPVDLYHFDVATGACVPFCVSDSEKSQFAHDGNLIVYRAHFAPGDDRIYAIFFSGGNEFEVAAHPGISPSVCGSLVAWAEASGSGFNIVAKDISTGEMRTVAFTTANPPRPQAGCGAIFWQDARNAASTGLDVYGCDWFTGQEFVVTAALGDQTKLRVCGDLVTWVTGPTNYQTLWGAYYTPPIAIDDFRPILVTRDSVSLTWTSPGSAANPPAAYDLRMRTDGPITPANWADSTAVPGLPVPGPPGWREEFVVQNLSPGPRYFALKARLANGEWSLMSRCVSAFVSAEDVQLREGLGFHISFTGIVTSTSGERTLYCQRSIGPAAVRARLAENQGPVNVGQRVVLTGVLAEDPEFVGPVLDDAYVIPRAGQSEVPPYAMPNRSVGGRDVLFGGTTEGGAPNTWTFVRVWGRVSDLGTAGGTSFRIDDGSCADARGRGIAVLGPFAPPAGLANGVWAVVDGIAQLSRASGRQIEVAREDQIRVLAE